jgi:hypothetical protein|tara:strand:- start:4387 stop:4731 length:345 start_codon:yes stop_codon:yes gene_type:complete
MKLKLSHILIVLLGLTILFNLGCKSKFEGMRGVKKHDIPEGDEHLYILKSEIVPPVCPKCPDGASCPRETPCPACPPCARCPEPAFTCKKVPNYTSRNQRELPLPMLNTFAAFK